jgi:hypothetical protein
MTNNKRSLFVPEENWNINTLNGKDRTVRQAADTANEAAMAAERWMCLADDDGGG